MKKAIIWIIGALSAIAGATALNQTFINQTLNTSNTWWTQTVMNPSVLGQTWLMPIVWTMVGILIITRDWEKMKEVAFPVTILMGTIGFHAHLIQYLITAIAFVITALSTETLGILWQTATRQFEKADTIIQARSYKKQTGTYAGFKDYQKIQKAEKQLLGKDTLTTMYNKRADEMADKAIADAIQFSSKKITPKMAKEIEANARARAKLSFRHVFEGGEKGVMIKDNMLLSNQFKNKQITRTQKGMNKYMKWQDKRPQFDISGMEKLQTRRESSWNSGMTQLLNRDKAREESYLRNMQSTIERDKRIQASMDDNDRRKNILADKIAKSIDAFMTRKEEFQEKWFGGNNR